MWFLARPCVKHSDAPVKLVAAPRAEQCCINREVGKLGLSRLPWKQEIAGSNLAFPTLLPNDNIMTRLLIVNILDYKQVGSFRNLPIHYGVNQNSGCGSVAELAKAPVPKTGEA